MSENNSKDKNKKKKNSRRAYLNDFQLQEDGKYEYKGTVYKYKGDWQECRKKLWMLSGLLAALVIAAGLLPSAGMINSFFVILPYVGEAAAAGFLIYAVIKMTQRDENVREYIYVKTFERFRSFFLFLFICSVMCLLGEILALILSKSMERLLFSVAFMVIQALIFGIASAFSRQEQAMKFEKVKID